MKLLCFALLASTTTNPASACEIDTPTDWLPGLSKPDVNERRASILDAWSASRMEARTEQLLKQSGTVYIARVVRSEQNFDYDRSSFSTEIEPVKAIKGRLPRTHKLEGLMPSSCGEAYGDGDGSYAKVGEILVVFEGLKKLKNRPNGIDSVRMLDVKWGPLLDPVQEWLERQPGYGVYPETNQ